MNDIISIVSDRKAQDPPAHDERCYSIYCTSYKRANRLGKLLAAVEFFIPSFELHLSCRLLRDDRGHQWLDLPRVKVEDPTGRVHHKALVRWATARAAEQFQQAGLAAIAEYHRNTATRRDPLLGSPRFAPLAAANRTLAQSASSDDHR
jgi:hypothetical protein